MQTNNDINFVCSEIFCDIIPNIHIPVFVVV